MIKLNLSKAMIRLMYKFVDVEFSGNVAVPDDRMIEYSYGLSQVVKNVKYGNVLDVGCVARINVIPQTLCELGYKVYGSDIRDFLYKHDNFKFTKGDISFCNFEDKFDAITLISALEHFGISGRYGIERNDDNADFRTIKKLRSILKPDGILIVTVPFALVGRNYGINRLYDEKRLGLLFSKNFITLDKRYYHRENEILVSTSTSNNDSHLFCWAGKNNTQEWDVDK